MSTPLNASVKTRLKAAGIPDTCLSDARFLKLGEILVELGTVAVAYSGGVDSTFLLRVADAVLGDGALGVLAFSESLDRNEFREALRVADQAHLKVVTIETKEYDNPEYRQNDGLRCFHCKNELFQKVIDFAADRGIRAVIDGSNADDASDYRPGLQARDLNAVRSPLAEAGLDKESIRRFSKALGLPTWDKPAAPCLSSRIPYGSEVTREKLRQVEKAEGALRELGYRVVRVRHHGSVARVELPSVELPGLFVGDRREEVVRAVKEAGFLFVAIDLEGFRSGSLNSALRAAAVPRRRDSAP